MMPSMLACWRTKSSARKPDEPAVSVWPLKNARNASWSMLPVSIASEEPDSALATPISAVKPLLDAAGLVIAKWNEPSAAWLWMSFQVTFGLSSQPKRCATDCFTPRMTGLSMIFCWSTILEPAPGSSDRYLPWLNHAASLASVPLAIFSAPSSVPI